MLKKDAEASGASPIIPGTSLIQTTGPGGELAAVDDDAPLTPDPRDARLAGVKRPPRPAPPPKPAAARPPQRADGPPPRRAVLPTGPPETPRAYPPAAARPGWLPPRHAQSPTALEDAVDNAQSAALIAPPAPPATDPRAASATVANGRATNVVSVMSGGAGQLPSGGAGQFPHAGPAFDGAAQPRVQATVPADDPAGLDDGDDETQGKKEGGGKAGDASAGEPSTAAGSSAAPASSSAKPASSVNVGAAVGGALGAAALIAAAVLGCRRCAKPPASNFLTSADVAERGMVVAAPALPTPATPASPAALAAVAVAAARARAASTGAESPAARARAVESPAAAATPDSPLGGLRAKYGGPAAPPPPARLFGSVHTSTDWSGPPSPAAGRWPTHGSEGTPTGGRAGALADGECACAGSFFARRAAHRAAGGVGALSFHEDGCPLGG
jgi:hypothetical protein